MCIYSVHCTYSIYTVHVESGRRRSVSSVQSAASITRCKLHSNRKSMHQKTKIAFLKKNSRRSAATVQLKASVNWVRGSTFSKSSSAFWEKLEEVKIQYGFLYLIHFSPAERARDFGATSCRSLCLMEARRRRRRWCSVS